MKPKPKTLGEVARDVYYSGKSPVLTIEDWSRAARAVVREHERRQWRPVSERPRKFPVMVFSVKSGLFDFAGNQAWLSHYSHWRPMPKRPKA
jgi:hypothetical protein